MGTIIKGNGNQIVANFVIEMQGGEMIVPADVEGAYNGKSCPNSSKQYVNPPANFPKNIQYKKGGEKYAKKAIDNRIPQHRRSRVKLWFLPLY